jgi:putative DNA methylase
MRASIVVPFSLKNAPSLIERIFPSLKISAEAQKERKAGASQTLTGLGSYWKGRKPLILVRACVLGCLLPATEKPEKDLEIFEHLMAIDDAAFRYRLKDATKLDATLKLPYDERVLKALRPEEVAADETGGSWTSVNEHLGTHAHSLETLVEQLGVMRFGRRPLVADTFAGGGSIPFEAARVGCDVYASDLNPIACMLTWGALNLTGGSAEYGANFKLAQTNIVAEVETEICRLGIEHDTDGNRAKAFLYCLEARCPSSGWLVPMLPSMIISKARNVVLDLIPDEENMRYDFALRTDVDADSMALAEPGTVQSGRLVHPKNPDGISISELRGDRKRPDGTTTNALRLWEKSDIVPRTDDIFQERLFCIFWARGTELEAGKSISRAESWFSIPTAADFQREAEVESYVRERLAEWQQHGFVPDMEIEPGEKTDEPIRTRGWTYWHHLFNPRQLMMHGLFAKYAAAGSEIDKTAAAFSIATGIDRNSRLIHWHPGTPGRSGGGATPKIEQVFYNQAFNTFPNPPSRSFAFLAGLLITDTGSFAFGRECEIQCHIPKELQREIDIYITDPPYADAVNYHELTEYFIAWLRKTRPLAFSDWTWDSRRRLAIKGKGEHFRAGMVEAYKAMADHMPANGIQIVMFTHQDGKVWSDMAQIFWGAGLQVMADWYIATETTSDLKKGGYVQGTHIIVLRKRSGSDSGYSDEITQEVKEEVARQIEDMVGLNQSLKGHGRSENLFNDADLQMAGYAAALRVLTKYVRIDGKDMTVEALRPRGKSERTNIDEIIEYAVQVANEHLVPEGMNEQTWRRLTGPERFYLKMMDIETTGAKKVDNYQNFAKAFRVADYGALMSSVGANSAALKSASDFGKRQMGADEFGNSLTRAILYGLWEMGKGVEDDVVLEHVRDLTTDYLEQRSDLVAIAGYIASKRSDIDRKEAQNAGILAGLIKNQRIG